MNLTKDEEKLYSAVLRAFSRYKVMDSKPRDYGTGYLLYSSEIHAIDMIGRSPDCNITGLSEKLGVTKGAVSQTVNKLAKKGLVEKYRDAGNDKEVYVRLTEKGVKAQQGFEDFHNMRDFSLHHYVKSLNDEQMVMLITFFQLLYDEISEMTK